MLGHVHDVSLGSFVSIRASAQRVRLTFSSRIWLTAHALTQSATCESRRPIGCAGIVPPQHALAIARAVAQETGQRVRIRDALTDSLIVTIKSPRS